MAGAGVLPVLLVVLTATALGQRYSVSGECMAQLMFEFVVIIILICDGRQPTKSNNYCQNHDWTDALLVASNWM